MQAEGAIKAHKIPRSSARLHAERRQDTFDMTVNRETKLTELNG